MSRMGRRWARVAWVCGARLLATLAVVTLSAQAQQAADTTAAQTPTDRPVVVSHGPHSWPEMPLEQRLERARQLVVAFTQRPIAEELQFVEERWEDKPFPRCVLELPGTGDRFEVEECDEGVIWWLFGRTMPDVGVSPADTETFEKAFCARFFPEVPSERLVQFQEHRWGELLQSGVILTTRKCFFTPNSKERRYRKCVKSSALPHTDIVP
ncbi:MAG: hypothetical protein ABFE16_03945, partial [Armatimonadia bacterium]